MATEQELTEKRQVARAALEGPDWTAKREREAKEQTAADERSRLEKQLVEIAQAKEKLELDWVRLDDRRQVLKGELTPILEREKQIEETEAKLEIDEAKTNAGKDQLEIEKKRQTIQETRRQTEKDKWVWQEKIWQIDGVIETNTTRYRALLDQEDAAKKRLRELHG